MIPLILHDHACASASPSEFRALIGGKAASLASLGAISAPIPRWFAITPRAFDESLGFTPAPHVIEAISAALAQLDESDGTADAAALYAVRSSSTEEDGEDHSFAGQFESFLAEPRDRVVGRVAAVWRSAFTSRVDAYRRDHGLSGGPPAPAVLVQRFIPADAAGVAFAADPVTGRRSVAIVSAVPGLGEKLVRGERDADTYHIDRDEIIRRRDIAAERPALPAITDAQAIAIARLARDASRHFGVPQDIEWALHGGRIHLLQSRPITTLAGLPDPDGELRIWDNANISESYSGVTTPLTFSFARHAYQGVYRQFCLIMNVPRGVVAAHSDMFDHMLGLIRGRVYYNLLNWYRMLSLLPGFKANRRFMEQMMGVREGLPDSIVARLSAATWVQRWRDRFRFAGCMMGLAANHFRIGRKRDAFLRRLAEALKPPAIPLESLRLDELAAEFRGLESRLLTRWDAPLINDFFTMIFFGLLRSLCAKWCSPRGPAEQANAHNDLLCADGVVSAEPARLIRRMAGFVAGDAALAALLRDGEAEAGVAAIESHDVLRPLYHDYLARFGDRCLEELKLESPTLDDDATPLLRAIGREAMRVSRPAPTPAATGRAVRDAAERRIADSLRRRPLRRLVFNWVLRNARRRVRDRELMRFERTRLFGRVRRLFVEMGRRLRSERRIDDERDVFYLSVEELLGFVEGIGLSSDLRAIIAARSREFAGYRVEPPPPGRFETRGAVHAGQAFTDSRCLEGAAANEPAAEGRASGMAGGGAVALRGLGCCAGVVRGPVRIVGNPREIRLDGPAILVAQQTDPGWVMLLPCAAGLLVERGSLLSHSAILAREMEVPTIVAIPGLMDALRDGQWVEMDGSAGTVTMIEPPGPTSPC